MKCVPAGALVYGGGGVWQSKGDVWGNGFQLHIAFEEVEGSGIRERVERAVRAADKQYFAILG